MSILNHPGGADRFYVLMVEDDPSYPPALKTQAERILGEHKILPRRIVWQEVTSCSEAIEELDRAEEERPGRGFDAVFLDLEIPAEPQNTAEKGNYRPGLEVAREVARQRWPGSLIGISQFANRDDLVEEKVSKLDQLDKKDGPLRPVFDDFLFKEAMIQIPELLRAKLKRLLIPVERYVSLAAQWESPWFALGYERKCLLRDLVRIAREPVISPLPLPRILLLGDPGLGKSALARVYDQLLRLDDETVYNREDGRPSMIEMNCAGLVESGEGGRLELFGYSTNAFGGNPRAGCFELATFGPGRRSPEGLLAQPDAEPDLDRAGIVFLDEFVELTLTLQASILKAIEESKLRRQDGVEVRIGCHVIFATNTALDGGDDGQPDPVRRDLLDRIPYVLKMPNLQHVPDLIRCMADSRLARLGTSLEREIEISASAEQLIDNAIKLGLIQSMRQVHSIAQVAAHETIITDSNLMWLLRKAELLGYGEELRRPAAGMTRSSKARILRLPEVFHTDDMPSSTAQVIDQLFDSLGASDSVESADQIFPRTTSGEELRLRYYLIARLLSPSQRQKIYGISPDAIRQRWNQAARRRKLDLSTSEEVERTITNYLLLEPPPDDAPASGASNS